MSDKRDVQYLLNEVESLKKRLNKYIHIHECPKCKHETANTDELDFGGLWCLPYSPERYRYYYICLTCGCKHRLVKTEQYEEVKEVKAEDE